MNKPEALDVYSFKPSTAKVKCYLHITFCNIICKNIK